MSRKSATPNAPVKWHDVQGLVVSGYADMHEARYLFLRVTDGARARAWIGDLATRVTASSGPEERSCVNVAFTAAGLTSLGLNDAALRTFAVPFQEGIAAAHRQRVLGDIGPSAPEHWAWGGTAATTELHVLLLLFAKDEATISEHAAHEAALLTAAGLEVVYELAPERLPGTVNVGKFGVEHFGFADGMSQPVIRGSRADRGLADSERRRSVIDAGEFVLGHLNGYGKQTPWPTLVGPEHGAEFGKNGTYLVVRQLAQDVAGFNRFLAQRATRPDGTVDEAGVERLAAKLVGRWRSGAPLVLAHDRDDPDLGAENGFAYSEIDPSGERCPFGAHIRRANPRDTKGNQPDEAIRLANLHRIIRRGRVYGPTPADLVTDDGIERGLFFVAINANIERQFEFVQHTWLNNSKFDGLYNEADALVGNPPEGGGRFTIQGAPLRTPVQGVANFVTVRGGAYLFMPGITALEMLAGGHT